MNGWDVLVSAMLPIDNTVTVCDIETKEECQLLTGTQTNAIEMDRKLIVSQEVYDIMASEFKKMKK